MNVRQTQNENSENEDTDDEVDDSIKLLRYTNWVPFGVEHKEEDLIGKWYEVIYRSKKKLILYVAKIKNRFLEDVDGPVCSLLMECLMPKTGSGNEIKATPTHLPPDISEFPLKDLIYGLLKVIPKEKDLRTYIVPKYQEVVSQFNALKGLDLKDM